MPHQGGKRRGIGVAESEDLALGTFGAELQHLGLRKSAQLLKNTPGVRMAVIYYSLKILTNHISSHNITANLSQ